MRGVKILQEPKLPKQKRHAVVGRKASQGTINQKEGEGQREEREMKDGKKKSTGKK